ncbi:MAG TPA: YraN family protein [Candidatus Cloacimonas sp.]|nr:YraN family protein [Candidatus Cloacimonas sp.]
MSTSKIISGQTGEEKAKNFLLNLGYQILKTNYHSAYGEIDIIAQDQEELVFVEVKTRAKDPETAFSSVSRSKQRKLVKTAANFLARNPQYQESFTRFDVIAVINKTSEIIHLKDAFTP